MVLNERTPTLPGVGIFLKFMSVLGLIPFGWNQKEGKLYPRHPLVFNYWTFTGVLLPAVHACASATLLAKSVCLVSNSVDSLRDVNNLLTLSLTFLLVLSNASFTCFAVIIMGNFEEVVKLYNETIHLRIQLRGE